MQSVHKHSNRLFGLVVALVLLAGGTDVHATGLFSSVDAEKPNPEFSQTGDRITAKFIPRAKSTSVTVEFQATDGGTIDHVKGIDFASVDRPEVDIKNFKSAVFEIAIRNVPRGGTTTLAMRSDFFSLSTAFYVFNPKRTEPWIKDAQKENRVLEQRVRELVVQVQDGGDLDADGAADGQIRLVGGPRDSFWGYALGTLFIRFFGIFFVLSLLMIGMIASGWVFTWLDRIRGGKTAAGAVKNSAPASAPATVPASTAPSGSRSLVPEAVVAAIGATLYLRETASRTAPSTAVPETGTAWSLAGRQRIMQERLAVFTAAERRREK